MSEPVEYLDLDDLVGLACQLLGDPPPIRDIGLLGSALGASSSSMAMSSASTNPSFDEIVERLGRHLREI